MQIQFLSFYDQYKEISFFCLQWLSLLIPSKSKLKSGDKRLAYKIHQSEPLLHFALCTGCHSDPAVLKNIFAKFFVLFLTRTNHMRSCNLTKLSHVPGSCIHSQRSSAGARDSKRRIHSSHIRDTQRQKSCFTEDCRVICKRIKIVHSWYDGNDPKVFTWISKKKCFKMSKWEVP